MSLRVRRPKGLERRHSEAHHAAGLVDLAGGVPAAHGEDTRRRQALEEDPPGLDRVEAVLRQGEGAGARGRPGVDQAHLDDVEGALGAGEPASRLIDLEGEAGLPTDGGVVREAPGQQVDEDRVDLDADHFGDTEQAR